MLSRAHLKNKKRIVVKVGSSSLTHDATGHISLIKMEKLIRQIADLKNSGREVILVSSGAQAVGIASLKLDAKPDEIEKKQAIASVGQAALMMIYHKLFSEYNIVPGQVLITKDILDQPGRKQNAQNAFRALLDYGVVPVVNENDTVATDEILVGDNDTLSAVVAEIVEADLLIILSDIDGLYDKDPTANTDAVLIDKIQKIDEKVLLMATGSRSLVGTGGMVTKLQAGLIVNKHNIEMVIANSEHPHVLQGIMDGALIGTLFTV